MSQQLEADKQGGAEGKSTEPCCVPQVRVARHAHFSPHLHQTERLPYSLAPPIRAVEHQEKVPADHLWFKTDTVKGGLKEIIHWDGTAQRLWRMYMLDWNGKRCVNVTDHWKTILEASSAGGTSAPLCLDVVAANTYNWQHFTITIIRLLVVSFMSCSRGNDEDIFLCISQN